MTIKEINKVRATVLPTEQEYFDAHSVEMVDTLLAEVDRLQAQPHAVGEWHNADDVRKLAVATEALERLRILTDNCTQEPLMNTIIDTALERIKE